MSLKQQSRVDALIRHWVYAVMITTEVCEDNSSDLPVRGERIDNPGSGYMTTSMNKGRTTKLRCWKVSTARAVDLRDVD
jgi:hypothetical protein